MKYRHDIGFQPLSDAQLQDIERETGWTATDRELLRLTLDEVTESFIVHHQQQQFNPPSKLANRMDSVSSAASRILKALGVEEDDPVSLDFEMFALLNAELSDDPRGPREDHVKPIIQHLVALCEASRSAAEKQKGLTKQSKNRHQGNPAREELLEVLSRVYTVHFQRTGIASISPDTGKVSGPRMRFVQSVLKAIRDNLSEAVIQTDPRISNTLRITPKAVREAKLRMDGQWKDIEYPFDPNQN